MRPDPVAVRLTVEVDLFGTGSVPRGGSLRTHSAHARTAGHWASRKLESPPEVMGDEISRYATRWQLPPR